MKTTKQDLGSKGKFGDFGGQFVPETLMFALEELEESYKKYITNNDFLSDLNNLANEYIGRPTPLYFAKNLSKIF